MDRFLRMIIFAGHQMMTDIVFIPNLRIRELYFYL